MQQQQNMMGLPTGGIKTAYHMGSMNYMHPVAKKPKVEQINHRDMQTHAAVPSNLATPGSGITGRLGYNLMGGHLQMPIKQESNNMQLPVGVGIRLGGIPASSDMGTAIQQQFGNDAVDNVGQMWPNLQQEGELNDQTTAERRQRNREHAKRSRIRKKFLLESLQADVRQLQTENEALRMLVQSKIPQHAQQIMNECCSKNPLFDDDNATKEKNKTELVSSDFSLIKSLTSGQQNFVLSDPRLPDNPIVYASNGFYELTGYTRDQVLGRNCRFLQGPGTDPKAVDVIRTAIANGTDATTCILNYKADGTPFWNQFFVAALRDSDNCIVNYVSIQSYSFYLTAYCDRELNFCSLFVSFVGWCSMCN
jgi:PAS domain S-box-containing protein